jgi:hypothetical protein
MPDGDGSVYVYGVLPAADRPPGSVDGVAGSPVRTVEYAGLAALVSDIEDRTLGAPREVRAHWAVLEHASKAATVVPARFATLMESEGAVRERLLEANAEELDGLLRELAGKVQLNLQGVYDEDTLLREVVRGSPAIAALRERVRTQSEQASYYDRIRLGEFVSAEIARRREEDAQHALARLEPLAVAAQWEEPRRAESAFNLAFLVARERVDAFSARVGELAEELGGRIHVRYVGPLPPYSFVDAHLSVGGEPWD